MGAPQLPVLAAVKKVLCVARLEEHPENIEEAVKEAVEGIAGHMIHM